jgi:hypothetical protein
MRVKQAGRNYDPNQLSVWTKAAIVDRAKQRGVLGVPGDLSRGRRGSSGTMVAVPSCGVPARQLAVLASLPDIWPDSFRWTYDGRYKDKTFANEIEKALEKEFPDGAGDVEGSAGRSFNTSLTAGSAKLESVARITRGGHLVDGDGNVTRVYKVSAILRPSNLFRAQLAVVFGYTVGARLRALSPNRTWRIRLYMLQREAHTALYARETNYNRGHNRYGSAR